jgi:hypothetical protein
MPLVFLAVLLLWVIKIDLSHSLLLWVGVFLEHGLFADKPTHAHIESQSSLSVSFLEETPICYCTIRETSYWKFGPFLSLFFSCFLEHNPFAS